MWEPAFDQALGVVMDRWDEQGGGEWFSAEWVTALATIVVDRAWAEAGLGPRRIDEASVECINKVVTTCHSTVVYP